MRCFHERRQNDERSASINGRDRQEAIMISSLAPPLSAVQDEYECGAEGEATRPRQSIAKVSIQARAAINGYDGQHAAADLSYRSIPGTVTQAR
jgi:hypothetical protein